MDEVRCPMCGKPNPAEAEVCLFCQARLKPLILSPADADSNPVVPDWLRSLRGAEEPEDDLPTGEENQADTLDWFDSPESQPAGEPLAPAPDASGGEEPVDWLADLGELEERLPEAAKDAAEAASTEVEPASSEDWGSLSEWLASLKREEPTAAPETAGAAWSSAVEGETQLPEEAIPAEPVEPASSDEGESLSEWLSSPEIEQPPTVVDWLSSIESEAQPAGEVEAVEVGEPAGEVEAAEVSEPAVELEAAEVNEPAAPGELPDWLTELAGSVPEDILQPIPLEPEAEAVPEESQDQVMAEMPEPGALEPEPVAPDLAAEPAEEAQELPDWLSQIDRTQEAVAGSVPAFTVDEYLALQSGEQAALEEATAEALSLPDWISELSAETPDETPDTDGGSEAGASLAQASLPDWLEAMRPVEAVAPEAPFVDRSDDHMESAGPLAGLRGVIPGEMGMLDQHKPPAYALKIPITDDQQARVGILQALVNAEGQEKPLPGRPARTNQLILRLVVFTLLVLVSVAALWIGPQTPLPTAEQIAPEVLSVQQHINSLLTDRPALLVLDYEPGFVDEMNTVVMPVLDHLVSRGVHIAFVSTSPTGPIIAVNLVNWINRQPMFVNNLWTNHTNLGFLPGGANGIRAFAQAPAQTLPSKLDGTLAWTGPLANAQQGLDQFSLVVVASDDPEGARQWIEQAGPLLQNKTPLILLTSAQAGPMVQPYYAPQTGLVSGLVSGMAGGADYHSATARASIVPLYWDAFSLALNVVVVFIVLGGFVSLISSSMTQRKAQKGEGNT